MSQEPLKITSGPISPELARCYIARYRDKYGYIDPTDPKKKRNAISLLFDSQDVVSVLKLILKQAIDELMSESEVDIQDYDLIFSNENLEAKIGELYGRIFGPGDISTESTVFNPSHLRLFLGLRKIKRIMDEHDPTKDIEEEVQTVVALGSHRKSANDPFEDYTNNMYDFSMPCPPFDCDGNNGSAIDLTSPQPGDCSGEPIPRFSPKPLEN